MLEGDVGLGAAVGDLEVSDRANQFGMRGSAQHLDHDGLLGGAEGLHRLVVGGLGQVFAIDLHKEEEEEEEEEERNRSATVVEKSV